MNHMNSFLLYNSVVKKTIKNVKKNPFKTIDKVNYTYYNTYQMKDTYYNMH